MHSAKSWGLNVIGLIVVGAALTGCGNDVSSSSSMPLGRVTIPTVTTNPGVTVSQSAANRAPTLAGKAPRSIEAGKTYLFQPAASDADGDSLNFAISSKPAWASFDANTGRLWGTPSRAQVGSYEEIAVTVTDGVHTAALPQFDVAVVASDAADSAANGSATLAWNPPTTNEDGSTLTNLAGYRIHYGTESGKYTQSVAVTNAGLTRFVVENLDSGTYFFAVTSLNSAGAESDYSDEAEAAI